MIREFPPSTVDNGYVDEPNTNWLWLLGIAQDPSAITPDNGDESPLRYPMKIE